MEEEKKKKLVLGKYELGVLIGQGNFGRVYHGKHIKTGESVAIKKMYKEQIKKQGMMDQIKQEISVMRLAKHPNIVELKEVMATKDKIYLIMEYLKGGDLYTKVEKEGGMKEDVARNYFQQLISTVDYCHSRGVCHRDLKLENLLLDEEGGCLKVADFGLSALVHHQGQVRDDLENRPLCHTGHHHVLLRTVCGAPAYVAPEVLRGRKNGGYDGVKADVWSCGVILYSLIAGKLPFLEENVMSLYRKIYAGQFDFPPGLTFSSEAKRLISKMLVVNPEKRITISMIKRLPWFIKGFQQPPAFMSSPSSAAADHQEDQLPSTGPGSPPPPPPPDNDTVINNNNYYSSANSPAVLNAFEFISSMSTGFDLSNLFETKKKFKSTFTSKCSAPTIMSKIETLMGTKLKYSVSKLKDFKMKLLGPSEGQKGRLSITAEVFEVVPEVAMVEFSKSAGDTLEYVKLCEDEIRPALKDIVWTWQGDNNSTTYKFNSSRRIKAAGY